jgi:hypothetical protein
VLLNGMFKGFIDLTFEHDGRYYVADYKSNWLGPDDSAYTQDAMEQSILEHRYDLQYVLYLLALHRQLKARLPDYDYDPPCRRRALSVPARHSGRQPGGVLHAAATGADREPGPDVPRPIVTAQG